MALAGVCMNGGKICLAPDLPSNSAAPRGLRVGEERGDGNLHKTKQEQSLGGKGRKLRATPRELNCGESNLPSTYPYIREQRLDGEQERKGHASRLLVIPTLWYGTVPRLFYRAISDSVFFWNWPRPIRWLLLFLPRQG